MKNSKQAFVRSVIALVLCVSMFVGTTFAWFTDEVVSVNNIIQTGILDVELEWFDEDTGAWKDVDQSTNVFSENSLWEPGYTEVVYLRVRNAGNLALKYQLGVRVASQTQGINVNDEPFLLSDYIYMGVATENIGENSFYADRDAARAAITSSNSLTSGKTVNGEMLKDEADEYFALVVYMPESVGNEANYKVGTTQPTINLGITLLATQMTAEGDAFGPDYDTNATFPVLKPGSVTVPVTPGADNRLTEDVAMVNEEGTISAVVPAGTLLNPGTTSLTFSVSELSATASNVVLKENEILRPMDVHIEGVAAGNTTPIQVTIKEAAMPGLNSGNYALYHVENGATNEMTDGALNAHNGFAYDPATGDVKLSMATFSEFALVADTENAWNGNFDYSWYMNAVAPIDGETVTEYIIANADQLAALGAIVGGMNGQTKDGFAGKTVKLIADINLGDKDNANENLIFHPIGYYYTDDKNADGTTGDYYSTVYSFEGTFDGNGHTIANFYQNTWEIKGDYDGNYYDVAMGLFGYVVNGTVKNLTVDNFSSDGEFTPTGVIAAYAVNSTFENIAITNCNPRVYNTGNGGIVGIGGNSDDPDTYKLTFNNITIDNTNIITALWGSWDVACGGLVGMFRGAGHVYMTNCHVAAQMDVYNDVCGNYQYYWYRYSGMMIGTNKNMITDKDGYTVPETSKFHAENCTVHFGTWNDYYYCELVANSLASYTHDHQFSRLVEIKAINGTTITYLDGTTGTVPASGRANYVIVNGEEGTENATCYHFLNGEVWEHEEAGTEIVNGKEVLKEDNQHIYLPFNQLFTGYGWGVKHIPVYNGEDYAFKGITILDREIANSIDKFVGLTPNLTGVKIGDTVTIDQLFKAISNPEVAIRHDSLIVSVVDLSNTGITADFTCGDTWEKSTLKFNGTGGMVKITIQDYFFCNPTSIIVQIGEFSTTDRFASNFDNADCLYRVGNKNAISISSLFYAQTLTRATADIGKISIVVTDLWDNKLNVYTAGDGEWNSGNIRFANDFTGPVQITISDDNYSTPLTLTLEVVDAYNVTKYGELKDQNSVLLNNIEMTSNSTYCLTGDKVLYGNGFTFDVQKGAYAGVEYDYMSYVIYLEDSRLDNVQIVGAVYPKVGSSRSEEYNRAIVMTNGECVITNCYISNGASPIRNGGNLELANTTLKGGAYANLDLRNGHLILDNVTTINQVDGNDKYNGSTDVVGMGIVVYQEGGSETLKITIRNALTQYNYLSKADADSLFTSTEATFIKNQVFGNNFQEYQNDGWVNFGIISMNDLFTAEDLADQRSNKVGYFGTAKPVSLAGKSRNCYVYSFKPAAADSVPYPGYVSAGQGAIAPNVEFDFTKTNYIPKVEGSNDYCYADGKVVYISMDEGDSFNWNTSILAATKNGQTLNYTVEVDGEDYTGRSVTFNKSGTHTVTYTYTDSNNYLLKDGTIQTTEKQYTQTITIEVSVVKAAAKHAEFTFGKGGKTYTAKLVTIGDKTYVMPDVTAAENGKIGSTTVNGITVYYPITDMYTSDNTNEHSGKWYACFPIFKDALQIIDYADNGTGDSITYNQDNVTKVDQIPNTLKAVDPQKAFLYSMNATNYPPPTDPTAVSGAVCYTCNRNGLDSGSNYPRQEQTIVAEYTYTDNTGVVYYFYIGYYCEQQIKKESGCVTGDTLVTLADGTQKRIDQVTYQDQLLVWDFYNGCYTTTTATSIYNHGDEKYEVINLNFSDGTSVGVIDCHEFFDVEANGFVCIDAVNVADYVGHKFVKADGDTYTTVTLTGYNFTYEETGCYTILTAVHFNAFVEGMLSLTPDPTHKCEDFFRHYAIGDNMKFDEKKMQEDIEKYGLFTYEDLADYVTYEEFVAFSGSYYKILIGKGYITIEDILLALSTYAPNH